MEQGTVTVTGTAAVGQRLEGAPTDRVGTNEPVHGVEGTVHRLFTDILEVPWTSRSVDVAASAVVDGEHLWLAGTSVAAARCDGVQEAAGEGPRRSALETGTDVLVEHVATDRRWPHWARAAAAEGFVSAGVAVGTYDDVRAAVTVHRRSRGAPCPEHLAVAARQARTLAHTLAMQREVARLSAETAQEDLRHESDAQVDRAVGIVMAQRRCSYADARGYLEDVAHRRGVPLRLLCDRTTRGVGRQAAPSLASF